MATQSDRSAGVPQQYSELQFRHTVREMRQFVVTEAELDQISLLNTLTSAFFSMASGSFLFAIGLWTSATMQGTISEKGTVLLQFGGIAGAVLALLFAVIGSLAWWKRKSIVDKLKRQAHDIDQISLLTTPRVDSAQSTPSIPDEGGSQS